MNKTGDQTSRWVIPVVVVVVVLVGGALSSVTGSHAPKLLGQSQEVEATRAVISWKTRPACFSLVEYWPTGSGLRTRSKPEPAALEEHRHSLTALSASTSYYVQLLYSSSAGGDYRPLSPVEFVFVTRAEIRFTNVHVEPTARSAEISWETDAKTDTVVKLSRGDGNERQVSNPQQQSETWHRLTVKALEPATQYRFRIVASTSEASVKPVIGGETTFSTTGGDGAAVADSTLAEASKAAADRYSKMTPQERADAARLLEEFVRPSPRSSEPESTDNPDQEAEFESRLEALRRRIEGLKRKGVDVDRWLKNEDVAKKIREIEESRSVRLLDAIERALDQINESQIRSFMSPDEPPPPLPPLRRSH